MRRMSLAIGQRMSLSYRKGVRALQIANQVRSVKFEEFARTLIESGRFESEEEVLEASMEALLREAGDPKTRLQQIHRAVDEGETSGIFDGDAFASVRRELGWEPEG
jgi:Arc/MetJ-type ribon-helix-helix transcriptional regulator